MTTFLALLSIILIHELAHLISGILLHIKIEKFCIMLDPFFCIFKTKIKNVQFVIGWLPLGGYVKINEASATRERLTIFYSAGVITNIGIGIAILKTKLIILFVAYFTNTMALNGFIETFAFLSIIIGIINLIPFQGTDGQKILQLWR